MAALRIGFAALSIGAAAVIGASRAAAVPVTWTFSGTVQVIDLQGGTSLPPGLTSLGVEVGAPVSGFLRFETETADADPGDPNVGQYRGAIDMSAITIGDWSLAKGLYVPYPEFSLHDVLVSSYPEQEIGALAADVDLYDPTHTFSSYTFFALELDTLFPGAITSEVMLVDPPSLSELHPFGFDPYSAYGYGSDVALFACGGVFCATIRAELTSLDRVALTPPLPIELPSAPEPSTTALVVLSAGLAAALARR